MTKKKKRFIILLMVFGSIIVTAVMAVAVVFAVGFPWSIMYIGGMLSEEPPQPVVTYGEFPFELVYEIDGEKVIIKDTLVIEYEGVEWNEGLGKYNVWNTYLKNGEMQLISYSDNDRALLLSVVDNEEIMIYLGSCEYYMGLEPLRDSFVTWGMNAGDVFLGGSCDLVSKTCGVLDEQALSKYSIRIIKKSISLPIG